MSTSRRIAVFLVALALTAPVSAEKRRRIEDNPARNPATPSASDLLWAKKSPYGAGDDYRLPLGDIPLCVLGDVDCSTPPASSEVLTFDGSAWVPGSAGAVLNGDLGDFTCTAGVCDLAAGVVGAAEIDESSIEGVLDLQDLQGAVTDPQVPDNITISLAAVANDLSCTDCIGPTEITDVYLLNTGDTFTGQIAGENAGGPVVVDEDPAVSGNPTLQPRKLNSGDGVGHDTLGMTLMQGGNAIVDVRSTGPRILGGRSLFLQDADDSNLIQFTPPGNITSNRACALRDDDRMIPASCVEDAFTTSPAGSDTYVQFNDGGGFGAEAAFAYNKTTNVLFVDTLYASLGGTFNDDLLVTKDYSAGFVDLTVENVAASGTAGASVTIRSGDSGVPGLRLEDQSGLRAYLYSALADTLTVEVGSSSFALAPYAGVFTSHETGLPLIWNLQHAEDDAGSDVRLNLSPPPLGDAEINVDDGSARAQISFPTDDSIVLKTGSGLTTALTIDASQAVTLAHPLAAASGGTGIDTSGSTGVPRIASGTWTTNAGISHLASSTSADLAGVLSDEVGNSGGFVRGTAGETDDCAKWDASGNVVSAGAACGTGTPEQVWMTTTTAAVSSSATRYLAVTGHTTPDANETLVRQLAADISPTRLRCQSQGAPGTAGSGKSYAITLRTGAGDTDCACTISDDATECEDTACTSLTGDNNFTYSVVPSGTPTGRYIRCSLWYTHP